MMNNQPRLGNGNRATKTCAWLTGRPRFVQRAQHVTFSSSRLSQRKVVPNPIAIWKIAKCAVKNILRRLFKENVTMHPVTEVKLTKKIVNCIARLEFTPRPALPKKTNSFPTLIRLCPPEANSNGIQTDQNRGGHNNAGTNFIRMTTNGTKYNFKMQK
ncbi:uncharacterized protein LOC119687228 [Teleopsis dalmanni]|uniref:uncharacterized protein LOC119687228 n=1 Tax=Teleopsis dalmanni TaxID=139649 RepID=UPI0018CDC96D|nr:uncharacterized protein LOC119687228 [Teleopsis dalmanni]